MPYMKMAAGAAAKNIKGLSFMLPTAIEATDSYSGAGLDASSASVSLLYRLVQWTLACTTLS